VTGVQTCAIPICNGAISKGIKPEVQKCVDRVMEQFSRE
jgi:hypothetical protein